MTNPLLDAHRYMPGKGVSTSFAIATAVASGATLVDGTWYSVWSDTNVHFSIVGTADTASPTLIANERSLPFQAFAGSQVSCVPIAAGTGTCYVDVYTADMRP